MKLLVAGLALAIALVPATVLGQAYPSKPIRVVVPFPPGGTSDTIARTLGQKLTEAWGQQVVVDNRAGVAGSLGAAIAAKSPPDGYTLLVGNVGPVAININTYRSVGYDPVKDFAPITLVVAGPQIVVVHPSVPAKTFKDFTALVKLHKGKLNYGSSGPGSVSHLAAELYKRMANVDLVHIPYKGSALITNDLIAGQVDVAFSDLPVVLPHVKSGRLRALAVTGAKPTALVPGVPTVEESGVPGFAITSWWGMLAPTGTPEPIITRLNTELIRILQLADVKERFANLGVETVTSTPAEFSAFIRLEIVKFTKLTNELGIKID